MTIWPDERKEQLRSDFEAGELSPRQMAAALGVTRNAVCGMLHRMGLTRGPRQPLQARLGPRKHRQKADKSPAPIQPPASPPNPEPPHEVYGPFRPVTLMDLTNVTCRYPVSDDGAPYLFCGKLEADLANGVPYCRTCSRVAFQPRRSTTARVTDRLIRY